MSLQTAISRRMRIVVAVTAASVLILSTNALAVPPVKEFPSASFGWEVDKTTKGIFCPFVSGDECQQGKESTNPGGFVFANGVAVGPSGDMYVADSGNHRVQELTVSGQFVSMFGWEVDKTTKGNVCTAASHDECGVGIEGGLGEQLGVDYGIAVDQTTGNVFVQDFSNVRVSEYSAGGEFILTLGREVDRTTKTDVCTKASKDQCGPGLESTEAGGFFFDHGGNMLAAGGVEEDTLYVGDQGRVQEFDPADGKSRGDISLGGIVDEPRQVTALTRDASCEQHQPVALTEATTPRCKEFDPEYGDVYVVAKTDGESHVIRKFTREGQEVKDGHFPLDLQPTSAKATIQVTGLSVDAEGRLAVAETEVFIIGGFRLFGALYDAHSAHFLTLFTTPGPIDGLAFSRESRLYAATAEFLAFSEIVEYEPRPVAELLTSDAQCKVVGEEKTDIQAICELKGLVDSGKVSETEVWFEWGNTLTLGNRTPRQPIEEEQLKEVFASVGPLRPNETYFYRLAGYDANVPSSEPPLTSETASFATSFVAPKLIDTPKAVFLKPSSAILAGHLNPENARTEYFFEYSKQPLATACPFGIRAESCPGVSATPVLESKSYSEQAAIQEAVGLDPGTDYYFRQFAESENAAGTARAQTVGPVGTFSTAQVAAVAAITGEPSFLATTRAVASGIVDGGGEAGTYEFELGRYTGTSTHYSVVFTGAIPLGTKGFVPESALLAGLQPNTTYAYRIRAENGYGTAVGEPRIFTTLPLAPILLGPLTPPTIVFTERPFPKEPAPRCRRGYRRAKHGRCVVIKKLTKHIQVTKRRHHKRKR